MRYVHLLIIFLCFGTGVIAQQTYQWIPGTLCQNCPSPPNPNKFQPAQVNNGNNILATSYTASACGLDYVQVTKPLFKRNFAALGNTISANQPTVFTVAGIPPGATVLKAFLYSDASGQSNVIPNVTITNQSASVTTSFSMSLIGTCSDKCWGYGGSQSYRADVTGIVNGNGNYVISGFPVMPQTPSYDTDGATLFVIYSDPTQAFTGNIVIADGCQGISGTVNSTVTGFNVCANAYQTTGFGLIGDLQRVSNTNFRFNSATNNFTKLQASDQVWDFVSSTITNVNQGQTSGNFGVSTGNDCYNFVMAGMYYRNICLACCTPSLLPLAVSGSSASICTGSSATLTAFPPGNYTWNPGNFVGPSLVVTPTISTYYSAVLTTSNYCGGTVLPVVVQPLPTLTLTPTPATVCPGLTSIINCSGAVSYTMLPGPVVSPGNTFAVNPTVTSVYTVSGSSNIGCTGSKTVAVGVFALPALAPTYTSPLCAGGSLSLSISQAFSYTWTGPPNFTTFVQNPVIPNVTAANGGIYTVSVFGPNNCFNSQTLNVICNPQLPVTPTVAPFGPVCNTTPAFSLQVNPPGGGWSGNSAVSQSGFLTPATASLGITSAVYTVMVGPCLNSTTIQIDASTFNTAALTNSVPNLCVTNSPFNLMNIVQSTVSGVWTGTGVTGSYSFDPSGLANGNYFISYSTTSSPNYSACPDNSTLTVQVTNTVIPQITQAPQFCNTFPPFSMTVNPSGGTWYGSGAVSPAGLITPSLALLSNTVLTYSVATGPCVNINTTSIAPSRFYSAALNSNQAQLCYNSNPYNLITVVQNTVNGVWFGINVANNTFTPGGLLTNTYALTYSTASSPNATLCPDTTVFSMAVLNPPVPAINNAGPYCSIDLPAQMTVSAGGTGTWIATSYLNSNGWLTPSLCAIGNNPITYVTGNSTCSIQQTNFISVEAFVPATVSGIIPDMCNTGQPLNLSPMTQSGNGVWSGPGMQGTFFNPALTGAGSFVLTHNTSSSPGGLCPDQKTVAVKVFSLATPVITPAGPYCSNESVKQLKVSPVGGYFSGINTFGINSSGYFNPALAIPGGNIISYSVSQGPCIAYAQSTIQVEKFVPADIVKYPPAFCKNDPPFNLYSLVQNTGGNWNGPGVSQHMFNPAKANIGHNNVITYTTYALPSGTMCPDTSTVRIRVDEVPEVSLKSSIYEGCAPLEVLLESNTTGGLSNWVFGDGSPVDPEQIASHIYYAPGSYTVTFTYTLGSCKTVTSLAKPVLVLENPLAGFDIEPEEITLSNPQATFINKSQVLGNNRYEWEIKGLGKLHQISPQVQFLKAGTYEVTLWAISYNGCRDEMTKTLVVKNEFEMYFPNSFTPENQDGRNDVFAPILTPYGFDEKSYEFEIFDRWGHQVFYTRDLSKGWNGTYQNKGQETLKQGVYIYKAKIKDLEGNLHFKTGNVLLLKG